VVFHQLTENEIVKIVDLMVAQLDERLKAKDMGIELTTGAKSLLAKRGYDPVLGARPLRRTIQRELEDVLSEKMLFGDLKAGEIILVDVSDETDAATFTFKGTPKSAMPDTFEDLTDPASA
jgi:ATP-dependent Clp protease ATP-binding subunit ClpC